MSCAVLKADTHTSVSPRLAPPPRPCLKFPSSWRLCTMRQRDASESLEWDKDPKFRCATLNKTLSMEGRWQTVKRRDKDGMPEELFFVFALYGAYNRTKNNKNLMDVFSYELRSSRKCWFSQTSLFSLLLFLIAVQENLKVKPILTSDRAKFELHNNQGISSSRDNWTPIRGFMTHRPMQASRVNNWSCISSFVAWQNRIMKSYQIVVMMTQTAR